MAGVTHCVTGVHEGLTCVCATSARWPAHVGPVSGVCGVWRRGRGSLLCVQESQQHVCDRDEAEGAGSACHPSSICSRLVGRGKEGHKPDAEFRQHRDEWVPHPADWGEPNMPSRHVHVSSEAHSVDCLCKPLHKFCTICGVLLGAQSFSQTPYGYYLLHGLSCFSGSDFFLFHLFSWRKSLPFFFWFVLALQSLVRCKFRATTTLVPITCYHHRRHCVSPGLYRLFINVTFQWSFLSLSLPEILEIYTTFFLKWALR